MPEIACGIYCRISLAALGDSTKTDEQERICRELASQRGWRVAEVYTDHARSAWQPNRKRPAWDRMLTDIGDGKIDAIVVYHGDRLLRTHDDLLALIKLARRGVKLASPAGTRDLGNYDDQFILEIEASMAKRESANTSRRRKAQYERWRREGKVRHGGRGGRAFGFATDGVTILEPEAAMVREAADRVLAGQGVGVICRDWHDRGIITVTGIPFGHNTLRKMLARPRYAGLMPDGASPAAWPAILERATWELVAAALDSRAAGFGYATNARKYLLSGLAVCGVCGKPLLAKSSKGRGAKRYQTGYACTEPGCRKVWRDQEMLDAYIQRRVVNRLNDPRNPEPQAPDTPGLAAEFAALSRALAETDDALADHTTGAVPALMARRAGIERRIAELRELAAGDAAARLRTAHRGISWEAFLALPLSTRRSLVQACFQVTVMPASKRGPGFRSQDVTVTAL